MGVLTLPWNKKCGFWKCCCALGPKGLPYNISTYGIYLFSWIKAKYIRPSFQDSVITKDHFEFAVFEAPRCCRRLSCRAALQNFFGRRWLLNANKVVRAKRLKGNGYWGQHVPKKLAPYGKLFIKVGPSCAHAEIGTRLTSACADTCSQWCRSTFFIPEWGKQS